MGNAVAPQPHTELPIRGPHWCTWCVQPCPGHDELGFCLAADRALIDRYRAWLRGDGEQPTPAPSGGLTAFSATAEGAWRLEVLLNNQRLPSRVWAASVAEGWVDVVAIDAQGFAQEWVKKDAQGKIIDRGPTCDRYYGAVVIRRKAGL